MTAPQIQGEALEARRADDRWEEHHGETDTVACRICGKRRERLGPKGPPGHLLREHELTVPQYHQYCRSQGWGTPPITSLNSQEAITRWRHANPEKVKAMGRTRNAKDKVRRATDPEFVKHEGVIIRKCKQSKLSDADKQVRVGFPYNRWRTFIARHG